MPKMKPPYHRVAHREDTLQRGESPILCGSMLLSRDEMTFDFGADKLDPVADKPIIEWMLNQFLYGEVTGIQVGHWLYRAPDLEAAKFLARQSLEEMQHVDNFLRIMAMLGCAPKRAHPAVRFLATGMMGGSWAEHVALEMAQGEGFVLQAFYAVIDTLDHSPSVEILRRAVKQEERHVEFGELQTQKAIAGKPWLRRRLLGLSLVSMWAVRRLARFMERRLGAESGVLRQLPAFLDHANRCAELRLRRIGVLDRPLADLSFAKRAALVVEAYGGKLLGAIGAVATFPLRLLPWLKQRRVTDTYLADPHVANYHLASGSGAAARVPEPESQP